MLGVHGMPWDVLQKGIQKMSILIKNGRVIDPDTRKDGRYDILIEEDKIVKVDQEIKEEAEEVIDAEGCYVMPGLIDLPCSLEGPGQTYKETVRQEQRSGTRRIYHRSGDAEYKAGNR